MDDGGPYNRRAAPTMIIALIVMFNTLGPILAPPTNLINASDPSPGTTEAGFRFKQVATKIFWVFTNSAFALALAAALVQVGKLVGHGTSEVCEKASFMLVMASLLLMSFASMYAVVVRLCPSSLLYAFSLVQGLCLLISACLCSCVFMAEIVG